MYLLIKPTQNLCAYNKSHKSYDHELDPLCRVARSHLCFGLISDKKVMSGPIIL